MGAFFKRGLTEDVFVSNNVFLVKRILKFCINAERIWVHNFVV